MKHSTKKMNDALKRLFTLDRSGPRVLYITKPRMQEEAMVTWRTHGVCLHCHTRAITGGRCTQCGTPPGTLGDGSN